MPCGRAARSRRKNPCARRHHFVAVGRPRRHRGGPGIGLERAREQLCAGETVCGGMVDLDHVGDAAPRRSSAARVDAHHRAVRLRGCRSDRREPRRWNRAGAPRSRSGDRSRAAVRPATPGFLCRWEHGSVDAERRAGVPWPPGAGTYLVEGQWRVRGRGINHHDLDGMHVSGERLPPEEVRIGSAHFDHRLGPMLCPGSDSRANPRPGPRWTQNAPAYVLRGSLG